MLLSASECKIVETLTTLQVVCLCHKTPLISRSTLRWNVQVPHCADFPGILPQQKKSESSCTTTEVPAISIEANNQKVNERHFRKTMCTSCHVPGNHVFVVVQYSKHFCRRDAYLYNWYSGSGLPRAIATKPSHKPNTKANQYVYS